MCKSKLNQTINEMWEEIFVEIEKAKPFLSAYYHNPKASKGIIDMREMEHQYEKK